MSRAHTKYDDFTLSLEQVDQLVGRDGLRLVGDRGAALVGRGNR